MNAFAVSGTPNLSTCAQDGYHEGFNLGIRYYPASSPQRRWAPMEVLPTLKKEQKKKEMRQSMTIKLHVRISNKVIHTPQII